MLAWIKKKPGPAVFIFYLFLLFCWIGLAFSFVRIGIGIAGEIPKLAHGEKFLGTMIDVLIEILLKRLVFLWILIHLQGIVLTISRKDPFNSRNPARIRKIAWGPFAYAFLGILSELYWTRARNFDSHDLISHIWGDTGRMILIGVGILIIAKVFTMGMKIQEDQNLTI